MSELDFEFMMRSIVWSAIVATAIVVMHWAYHKPEYRLVSLGIAGKSIGWAVHQFYWFQVWLARSVDVDMDRYNHLLTDWRWITYASEAVIVACTVLVLSPYLEKRVGHNWLWATTGFVAGLMGIAYTVGTPPR